MQLNEYSDNSFAAACYNDNSIEELMLSLAEQPDVSDMQNWKISPDEWRDSINAALNSRVSELAGTDVRITLVLKSV